MKARAPLLIAVLGLVAAAPALAQIDPEPRQLLHLGYNQPLREDGPNEAYAFFYWNIPEFPESNQTLRMVFAPTFLTTELGFRGLLGEQTDLAVEVFGGGFHNNDDELRRGDYTAMNPFSATAAASTSASIICLTPAPGSR